MILLDKANKYVDEVLSGKEITTWEVKRQCEIYKDDFDNQNNEEFPYYFDEKQVKKIDNLLKLMNFGDGIGVTGCTVSEGIVGFQAFMLVNIFGWRFKENKIRMRYRDIFLFISRKNAKTWISGIIFILLMLTEPKYSKFYSICLSKDLASEVRESIRITIESSPALIKHFIISKTPTGKIECKLTKNTYLPRTAEAGKNNAIKPNCYISDEHANFDDRRNYNAMRSGQRNITNAITIITTTGYEKSNSIVNDDLDYVRKVFKGEINNDRYFALIYYAEKEHWWDDIGIYQANPLRIEQNYQEIRESREKARIIESEQGEYLTKSMNVMLESNEGNKYIAIDYWKKCRVDDINFEGKEVIVGVDLSVTTDLTAVSMMFRDEDKIYCISHGFLPKDSLEKRRENINYRLMERNGYCDIHDGMTVNYTLVEEYIRSLEEVYKCTIKYIVTDPMNAKEMMERLAYDYDVILLKQTYTNLSPATKEFRKMVYDGNVFYKKNELLDWMMGNAITTKGKSDDEMLSKENKNKERIDMVAVLIFAYTQLLLQEEEYSLEEAFKSVEKWNNM